MDEILRGARIGARVAFVDVSRNLFRPLHNLRVAFGLEREPSLAEMIRREERRQQSQARSSPQSRRR